MKRFFIFFVLVIAQCAFAGIDPNANQADSLLATFQSASTSWREAILPSAKYIFYVLVFIDWVVDFGFMAIKGTDLGEILAVLIRKSLVIGFFLMLFTYSEWLSTIPASFNQLADTVAGVSVTPDNVLSYAFKIVNTVWKGLSLSPLELGDSLILVFSGIVMLIAFAVMSAQLFMTIVKSYTLLAIAPLIFSLGGLQNTRQMAYNPFFAIIKVGLELLLIKLFMGLTLTKIQAFASSVNDDNSSLIAMMTIAIVIASVVHMIPGMVESVMSGSLGQNSTSGIGTAAMVSGGALGAAKSATGMGLAVKAASSLAKEQRAAGDTTASTFKNLRSAFADDIKRSMAGENIGNGTMGARMAFKHSTDASLAAQTKAMKENGSAPNNNMKATANEEAAFASQQKENDGK